MFFTFVQNNSGGSFEMNEDVTRYMIIEANSANEANDRAERIGIYFNGCDEDIDCLCCGDRWYPVDDCDGKETPSIYSKPVDKFMPLRGLKYRHTPYAYVYYLNGTRAIYS